MPKVTFIIDGEPQTVAFEHGTLEYSHHGKPESLLDIAKNLGVKLEHACGGNGFCTTCLCQVRAGMENLNDRNDREENMGVTMDPYRLGCQTRVKAEGEVSSDISVSRVLFFANRVSEEPL